MAIQKSSKKDPFAPQVPGTKVAESDQLFRLLLEAAPDAIVVADDQGRIRLVNHQVETLFGYRPEELIGRKVELLVPDRVKLLHPTHRERYMRDPQMRPMGAGLELSGRRKDGTEFPVDISLSSIKTDEGLLVSAALRDVTDRKRVEDRNRLFQSLLEAAPDAIVVVDAKGEIRLVNRQLEVLFGYTREELLGKSVDLLVPDRVRGIHPGHRSKYVADRRTRPMGARLDLSARRKDGTEFPVDISLSSVETSEGILVSAALRDVSDLKRAEERNRLAAIVDSSSDAIFAKTLEGTITSWNPAAERIYGWSALEAIGRSVAMIYPSDREDELISTLQRVRAGERVEGLQTVRMHRSGVLIDMVVSMSPIRDERGNIVGAASIGRDITDQLAATKQRQRLETELQQSQRLESVGQLAGGIAHDFNNLIAVVMNYATFVADELEDRPALREDVEEIRRAGERAAALTRQLLIFSRREVAHPELLDINSVVSDMRKLMERTIGEHIELLTNTATELWPVLVDRGQLEQVLMNLSVNARDAMQHGGRLLIETSNAQLDEDFVAVLPGLAPGQYVRLAVSDSGEGMTRQVADRAFEPFFTTKPKGQGTGLGLATVYGIVSQAGGKVGIYSEVGRGTTVSIHLPAAETEVRALASVQTSEQLQGHGESVLLVEDEPGVRGAARRILGRGGYAVLEAETPAAALALIGDRDRPIALVLTDVVMPEMSGMELVRRIRVQRPDVPVLFMSGYPQEVIAQQGLAPSDMRLLEKPFTRAALLAAVGAALVRS